MATFVLFTVHGTGVVLDTTETKLCALGHEVHAPTLTGLGERAHLLSADITADTHVTDIVIPSVGATLERLFWWAIPVAD